MPFHHPVRLAVQLALLDNLSKGRIDVGIGKGTVYNEYEFVGHGLRSHDSRERMEEAVEIIERAWREAPLTYDGKFHKVHVPALRPKPVQQPGPPLWRSVISPGSFTECGKLGVPILTARLPVARIKERWATYAEGIDAGGHDEATKARLLAQSALWRNVYVAESDAQAEDELAALLVETRTHMMHVREAYNPPDFQPEPGDAERLDRSQGGRRRGDPLRAADRLALRLAGAGARAGGRAARCRRAAPALPDRLRRHEPRAEHRLDAPLRRTGDAGVQVRHGRR